MCQKLDMCVMCMHVCVMCVCGVYVWCVCACDVCVCDSVLVWIECNVVNMLSTME